MTLYAFSLLTTASHAADHCLTRHTASVLRRGVAWHTQIYDANIIADACLFLIYAVLFLVYGLRILVERRAQATQLWGDMKEVWKVQPTDQTLDTLLFFYFFIPLTFFLSPQMLGTTMIFTACFCCRVVMFLYRYPFA